MERRKKGSGQITYVDEPSRKSKWRATVTDDRGKKKTRYFKTEKDAKAFLREVNSDASKLKSLMETGVTFNAFSQVFLDWRRPNTLLTRFPCSTLPYHALKRKMKTDRLRKIGCETTSLLEKKKGNMKATAYKALEYNVSLACDMIGKPKLSDIDSDIKML